MHSYIYKKINCPICNIDDTHYFGNKNKKYYLDNIVFHDNFVVRCKKCGLIYVNPMPFPTKEQEARNYMDYFSKYVPYKDIDRTGGHFKKIRESYNKTVRHTPSSKGKMLEVGCAGGDLLCFFREKGWEVFGIEIDQTSCSFAIHQNQLNVSFQKLQRDTFEKDSFDIIYLNSVLEHIHKPVPFMEILQKIIKRRGVLYCALPNELSLVKKIGNLYFKLKKADWTTNLSPTSNPFHVFGYSKKSLKALLEKFSFQPVEIFTKPVLSANLPIKNNFEGIILKNGRMAVSKLGAYLDSGEYLHVISKYMP